MTAETKRSLGLEELFAELDRPQPIQRRIRSRLHRAKDKIHWLRRRPRYAWQRVRRGYSEEDTWGFHYHLAPLIAGGVRRLRERQLGHPSNITAEEWDSILDQIIEGFEAGLDPWEMTDVEVAKFKRGGELFIEYFFNLWD